MVYTLAKALHISPLEVYQMPIELFMDMLIIHGEVENLKVEEINKQRSKIKK